MKSRSKPSRAAKATPAPAGRVRKKPAARPSAAATKAKAPARAPAVRRGAPAAAPAVTPSASQPRHALPAAEREKFRRVLVGLRSNRSSDKESREREALKAAGQDVSVDHMADFGSDHYEQEFTLGLIELDVETLRDIDDALVKIERGGYGVCEDCGEKIARARLAAIPYARLCITCKMKDEPA